MTVTLSMIAVLALFYTIFLGQIYYLSVYIPGRICARVQYVMDQFPPADYPKLYPAPYDRFVEKAGKRKLRLFRGINYTIALVGISILAAMLWSGYQPDVKGGDETFVMMYFFLQIVPIFYAQLKEYRQYKLMRASYTARRRSADLAPRRLFDFISPVYVAIAVLAYAGWLIAYLSSREFGVQPDWEIYVTVFGVTGLNIFFAVTVARKIAGKKENPYQAYADQLRQIEVVVKVMVLASIGMSFFLTMTQLADQYALEIFDPVLSSLYFLFCAAYGIGFCFKTLALEKTDFEVYKDDASAVSS